MIRIIVLSIVVVSFVGCAKNLRKEPIQLAGNKSEWVKSPPPATVMPQDIPAAAEAPEPARKAAETPYRIVSFGFDSDAVPGPVIDELTYLRNTVKPGTSIRLIGGACPIGDYCYNYGLGIRRAAAVQEILAGRCPVEISSVGETNLITDDPNRYAENRRCEIWVD